MPGWSSWLAERTGVLLVAEVRYAVRVSGHSSDATAVASREGLEHAVDPSVRSCVVNCPTSRRCSASCAGFDSWAWSWSRSGGCPNRERGNHHRGPPSTLFTRAGPPHIEGRVARPAVDSTLAPLVILAKRFGDTAGHPGCNACDQRLLPSDRFPAVGGPMADDPTTRYGNDAATGPGGSSRPSRAAVSARSSGAATDSDPRPPGRCRFRPRARTPKRWPTPGCCCRLRWASASASRRSLTSW